MSKQETGAKSAVRMQPLAVYEYRDLANIKEKFGASLSRIFDSLNDGYHECVTPSSDTELAHNRWLYIFTINAGKPSLFIEGLLTVKNGIQEIQKVDWTPTQIKKRRSEEVRPASGPKSQWLTLDVNQSYIVLLSHAQLHISRLDYYSKWPIPLNGRCQELSAQKTPNCLNSKTAFPIFLFSPLIISERLRETLDTSQCIVEHLNTDEESITKRLYFRTVKSLDKSSPDIRKWLDWIAFNRDYDNFKSSDENARLRMENLQHWLLFIRLTPMYRTALFDLSGSENLLKDAARHSQKVTQLTDFRYLAWEVQQVDSWFRLMAGMPDKNNPVKSSLSKSLEPGFQAFRKTIAIAADGKLADFVTQCIMGRAIAIIMASPNGTSTRARFDGIERIVSEFNDIIDLHGWRSQFPSNPMDRRTVHGSNPGNYISLLRNSSGATLASRFTTNAQGIVANSQSSTNHGVPATDARIGNYATDVSERIRYYQSCGNVAKKIFAVIEGVNLAIATTKYADDPKATNAINEVGAICDATSSLEFLLKDRLEAWVRSQPKLLKLFGAKIAGRTFAIVGVIAGITDAYGAYQGTSEALSKKKLGVATGNILVGASSIVAIAASVSTIASTGAAVAVGTTALTTGGALLALVGGPIGLIALAVMALGMLIIYLCEESDLETWCKNSRWGKRWDKKTSINQEFSSLLDILCAIRPSCRLRVVEDRPLTHSSPFLVAPSHVFSSALVARFELGPLFNPGVSRLFFKVKISLSGLFSDTLIFQTKERMILEPGAGKISHNHDAWEIELPYDAKHAVGRKLSDEELANASLMYEFEDVYVDLNGVKPEKAIPPLKGRQLFEKLIPAREGGITAKGSLDKVRSQSLLA